MSLSNEARSARFGDLLGLWGQKHPEAQRKSGTRKWCPGTAEKLKDVSEISVVFSSLILERQSQPEKICKLGITCYVDMSNPQSFSFSKMCHLTGWPRSFP